MACRGFQWDLRTSGAGDDGEMPEEPGDLDVLDRLLRAIFRRHDILSLTKLPPPGGKQEADERRGLERGTRMMLVSVRSRGSMQPLREYRLEHPPVGGAERLLNAMS
jgi:hypothetical protein